MKVSTVHYVKPLSVAVLTALSISFSGSVFAVAGKFQFVNGEVQVIEASGAKRAVKKGDVVNEGDTVSASASGFAQLKMEDGGFFAVRPETEFKVDTFQFNGKEDGSEKGVFSLIKGSLRSVTGLIGKKHKDNYKIQTATSTIGIRGSGADVGHSPSVGTAVRTLFGGHSLTSGGKTVNTAPGQTAMAAPGQEPKIVPNFPFNTSTTAGGQGKGGDQPSGDSSSNADNQSTGSSTQDPPSTSQNQQQNSPPPVVAKEVVIPIEDTTGRNFTNPGDTTFSGPAGSGGSAVGLVNYDGFYPHNEFAEVGTIGNEYYSDSFSSTVDSSGRLVGWQSSYSSNEGPYYSNSESTTFAMGSAGFVAGAAGSDASLGVTWGAWAPGWTVHRAYSNSHLDYQTQQTITDSGSYDLETLGSLAFITGTHISTWADIETPLVMAGIVANYSYAGGNAIFADGTLGTITSASAQFDFTKGTVDDYRFTVDGGTKGIWSAEGYGSLSQFMGGQTYRGDSGIELYGSCSGAASGMCQSDGAELQGYATAGLVGTSADGLISTYYLSGNYYYQEGDEYLAGALYLKKTADILPTERNYMHFVTAVKDTGEGFTVTEQYAENTTYSKSNYTFNSNGGLIGVAASSREDFDAETQGQQDGTPSSWTVTSGSTYDTYHTPDNTLFISRGANVKVGSDTFVSTHSVVGEVTAPALVQTLIGNVNYSFERGTSPTDGHGNVGTLNDAWLNVNFTAQTATFGVDVGINDKNLVASATNIPILRDGFEADSMTGLTVTCSGSCANPSDYVGSVGGAFFGSAALSAAMGYEFAPTNNTTGNFTDYIHGVVAFTADSVSYYESVAGVVGGGGAAVGSIHPDFGGSFNDFNVVDNVNFAARHDLDGNLIAWIKDSTNGETSFALGEAAIVQDGADATNGVIWGRWDSGYSANVRANVNGHDQSASLGPVGGLSFITGTHITTAAELANFANFTGSGLSTVGGAITGTYSLASGNFVTGVNGVTDGTITSASAIVNFTTANITAFNVAGTSTALGAWSATGAGSINNFMAKNGATGLVLSGTAAGGALTGGALNGTAVGGFVGNQAQGLISTVGLTNGIDANLGGAVYMKR